MEWELHLQRVTKNALNVDIAKKNLQRIAAVAERNTAFGFRTKLMGLTHLGSPEQAFTNDGGEQKCYNITLKVSEKKARTEEVAKRRWEHVLKLVKKKAGKFNWEVFITKGEAATAQKSIVQVAPSDNGLGLEAEAVPRPRFQLPDLNKNVLTQFFEGIYERDSHVRLIHDAMSLFVSTNGEMRPHVLLHGEPAAAKTELFKRLKKWYEQDGCERVAEIDGHAMSRAGLEGWVIERCNDNNLPEVLLIEEIEKQDEKILLPLISIMGSGYFAKLNARIDFRGSTPFIVWATCNDLEKLKGFAKGALYSRFTNEWECRRPSRPLMVRILNREIKRIPNGNPQWAIKAMELGWDRLTIRDPRKIIGLLAGRDRLLDGSYAEDQIAVVGEQNASV